MMYWEEFTTKYGFSDGNSVPPDAYACRYVYVKEINKMAEKARSKCRLLAYDRGGCHNPYLILTVPAKLVKGANAEKLCTGDWLPKRGDSFEECQADARLERCVEKAMELDLDCYVETKVTISSKVKGKCINRK